MGRSGDGKQNILWGWPYHNKMHNYPIAYIHVVDMNFEDDRVNAN